MRHFNAARFVGLGLVWIGTGACASGAAEGDVAADSRDDVDVGDLDGDVAADSQDDADVGDSDGAVQCCPVAQAPTCDCFQLGGNRVDGCIGSVCDAIPTGWTLTEDRFGCAQWVGGDSGSCLPFPDGRDADTSDDLGFETNDAVSDADTDEPGEVDPLFGLAGEIAIIEQYSGGLGEVAGSWIYVALRDRPAPASYVLRAADGDCKVFTPEITSCEPTCGEGEVCDANAHCAPYAVGVSAGEIVFDGLAKGPYTAQYVGEGQYVVAPEPPPGGSGDGLFGPSDAIKVSAAGADVPAFAASVSGVADLQIPTIGLVELTDQAATTLTWTPAGDGSRVEVRLQLGWHGRAPTGIIACSAPDAAGQVVISPSVIKPFPYFGGVGLFQVPSWMARVSRTIVATPAGPIAVSAESRVNLGVTHTEE